MSTSKRGRKNILKPCPTCGKLRGRTFDLPRVDDGCGGRTIVMPGGGMIPEARLCSCPKGERPFFRFGPRKPDVPHVSEDLAYRIIEDRGGITEACRVCFWQECGECFCEDLAEVTSGSPRSGERISGNPLLIERCRQGPYWKDKVGTIARGLENIFGCQVEIVTGDA